VKSVLRALSLVSICLLPVIAAAATAAVAPVEMHLSKDGESTHVHVSIGSTDVVELRVELFDARGNSLGTYGVEPGEGDSFRSEVSFGFAPKIATKVESARVTGVSLRPSGDRQTVFNDLIKAVPRSCAGLCNPTRIQCNNHCFCEGCVWATYSCTEESGCQASCNCHDCYWPPEESC